MYLWKLLCFADLETDYDSVENEPEQSDTNTNPRNLTGQMHNSKNGNF